MISQVRYLRCPVTDYDDEQKKVYLAPHLEWFTNATKIAQVGDVVILDMLIGTETCNYIKETKGIDDPFTLDAVQEMALEWYYIGDKESDIIALYPELAGQYQDGVDEDGNPIMRDKIDSSKWYGFE